METGDLRRHIKDGLKAGCRNVFKEPVDENCEPCATIEPEISLDANRRSQAQRLLKIQKRAEEARAAGLPNPRCTQR